MTKRTTKSNVEVPSILLKTLHDDIMRSSPTSTITTKIMRTWLRVHMRDTHVHNQPWMFTTSQAHDVRMKYDAKYRATYEKAQKPVVARKSRAKKDVVANDVVAIDLVKADA